MAFVVLRQICFLFNFNLVEIWSFRANSTVGLRKPKRVRAASDSASRDVVGSWCCLSSIVVH